MAKSKRAPPSKRNPKPPDASPFLRSVGITHPAPGDDGPAFPFTVPAIANTKALAFHPKMTFFVGENGSGKSTLLEAIAIAAGFPAAGGTKNFRFGELQSSRERSDSGLEAQLQLVRGTRREQDGFFLRAESFFNVASKVDEIGMQGAYGGVSLHQQSHGEAFLALVEHRFSRDSLFLMDEPEAALSPQRQLAMLSFMRVLVEQMRCQMVIATHSPILLAYPDAAIYRFDETGVREQPYEETEHYLITRDFLNDRERFFRRLFAPG